MKHALILLATLLAAAPLARAQEPAPAPLTGRLTELLARVSNGHSPSPGEIAALTTAPAAAVTLADLKQALPLLLKALENPDTPVRAYALTTLITLEDAPSAEPAPTSTPDPNAPAANQNAPKTVAPPPTGPATFKPDLQTLLSPAIPSIATHLTEESQPLRILTAGILGGFAPNPPAAVYAPLLAYLKRDDATGPAGLSVVQDLLQLAPLTPETSAALAAYLRRSDQTADSRANLIDAIATAPNQSQSLNKAILTFLDSDDPSLRARVILSLPALDLAQDSFADAKSRVSILAANSQDNLQVISAAKAVAPCWTAPRMTTGCPVYQ